MDKTRTEKPDSGVRNAPRSRRDAGADAVSSASGIKHAPPATSTSATGYKARKAATCFDGIREALQAHSQGNGRTKYERTLDEEKEGIGHISAIHVSPNPVEAHLWNNTDVTRQAKVDIRPTHETERELCHISLWAKRTISGLIRVRRSL